MDNRLVDDLLRYLKVQGRTDGGPMSPHTVKETHKVLRRMQRLGFELGAFVQDVDAALRETHRFLAHVHDQVAESADGGQHGYNHYVRAVKALARWQDFDLGRIGYMRWDAPDNRALSDEEIAAIWTFQDDDPEAELRALALVQYALTIGWDRGEIAPLEERDLSPPIDCGWRPRSIDHRLQVPITYGTDVGSVYCRVPYKGSWRRWVETPATLWNDHFPFLQWVQERPIDPQNPGAVWTTSKGGPKHKRRTRQIPGVELAAILRIVKARTGLVELNFRRTRHTCGSVKVEEKKPLRLIAYDLGHRSWESCFIYTEPRRGYRLRWGKAERGVLGRVSPSPAVFVRDSGASPPPSPAEGDVPASMQTTVRPVFRTAGGLERDGATATAPTTDDQEVVRVVPREKVQRARGDSNPGSPEDSEPPSLPLLLVARRKACEKPKDKSPS